MPSLFLGGDSNGGHVAGVVAQRDPAARHGDGVVDANDLIIITVGGVDYTVAPTGLWFPRMLYTPPILPAGDDLEVKMVADATGNITPIWEPSEQKGIFYWLQFGQ